MPRLLALTLILAVASLALADDADVEAKETLRQGLCDAFRAQETIHHALRWEINPVDREPFALFTEYFQSGDVAGLRILHTAGEDTVEYGLAATDGMSIRYESEGQSAPGTGGAAWMNSYYAPYVEARRRLAKRWGVEIDDATFRIAPHLHLEEDDEGPGIVYRLACSQEEAPAGWLQRSYFDDLKTSVIAEEGVVRLEGKHIEGTLRLQDGLPLSWSSRNPRTGGTARAEAAATAWSVERWRQEIARLCPTGSTAGGNEWEAQIREMAMDQLLGAVIEAVPDVLDDADELTALIEETVTADLERRGPARLPSGLDETTREARLAGRAQEVGSAFRELAVDAGWSEAAADALADRAAAAWRSFADDGADNAAEALRRRLCDALRAQPSIHHALAWDVRLPGREPYTQRTEYFREGDRVGMRIELVMRGESVHRQLIVADGDAFRYLLADGEVGGTLGVPPLNEHYAPYLEARRRLSARWDVTIPWGPYHVAPILEIYVEDGAPSIASYLLPIRDEAPVGWLRAVYFRGFEVEILEAKGLARVRSPYVAGTLRLRDGLPLFWTSLGPEDRGTVTGGTARTRWDPARWREEIDRLCSARSEAIVEGEEAFAAQALVLFLDDVVEAVPGLLDYPARVDALVEEAVTADLERYGPASLPPDADASSRQAHVTERAEAVRSAFRELAVEAEWSEAAAKALGDRAAEAWRAGFETAETR